MYIRVLDNAVPRNAIENIGAMQRSRVDANVRSQEKCAGERPDDSSRSREYRWRKKMW
jgi:hypothetical protein